MQRAEQRLSITTGALLLLLAAIAWLVLPLSMPIFFASWFVMTVAMMVPATLPVLLLHRANAARQGRGPLPTLAFLGGYLLTWAAAGLAAWAVVSGLGRLGLPTGAVLVVAGLYQLSPVKQACLKACRNPLTVLFELGRSDFAGGLRHGAWCVACCWSLMAVLLLVASMSLAWMAVLTVVFLLEKAHPRGPAVARAVGVLLVLLGLAGLIRPELLTRLAGGM